MEGFINKFRMDLEYRGLIVYDIEFCENILREIEKDCGLNEETIKKITIKLKEKNEYSLIEWLDF